MLWSDAHQRRNGVPGRLERCGGLGGWLSGYGLGWAIIGTVGFWGFCGGAEEGRLVASPAASLRPAAARGALCAGWIFVRAEARTLQGLVVGKGGGFGWVRGTRGPSAALRMTGGLGGVEMGGGGRARRAIPAHRKARDEWGTRHLQRPEKLTDPIICGLPPRALSRLRLSTRSV